MNIWNKLDQTLYSTNEWLSKICWFVIFYLMIFGVYDVMMRYIFNSPSLWIWLSLQFGMVTMACLGGAYALQKGAFVKLDLIYGRLSTRTKAILDIITFSFTLLYSFVLVWKGIEAANTAWSIHQMTSTAIRLPLYHLKSLIPLGGLLVMLVAIRKLIMDIKILRGRTQSESRTSGIFSQGGS